MKNKLATNFKKITSYVLALSIIFTSFGFVPAVQASPVGPIVTIGSQSASNGATINVPVNASNFANAVAGMDFSVQYDPALLTYTGLTQNDISGHGLLTANSNTNTIIINWFDSVALNTDNGILLTLNFTVISGATANANLSFAGITALSDSIGDPVAASFVDGVISLNPASTVATITSGTYTVSAGETASETIINIPFGTSKADFLAALTKGEANQTWDDTGIANPVVTGNILVVTAEDGITTVTYTVAVALNPAKAITVYSFPEGVGVINEGAKTIAVTVPFGTNVTALVPTIVITGASVNPASGVAQDFTNPVAYTVTAADATTQIYTVTVTVAAPSNIATVTSATYTVSAGGTVAETITNIPFGTTKAVFLASLVKGQAGQSWADTGLSNPVVTGNTLVVTAQDGTTIVTYTLTVALNPAKSITSFDFSSPSVMGVINETTHTITLTVPYGTDVTTLIPTIAVSAGATVNPASAVAQNFASPITYTATAADYSTQNYVVSITVVAATQTVPATDGTAIISSTTPQVVVSSPTQAVTVTVSSGTSNPSINYGSLIFGGTGIIPQTTIDSTSADIVIPASTTVTSASTTWDGVITAPTVTTVTLPDTSGYTKTLSTAIEIGFTGAKLSFDKAVRILLPGQAGKRAGYVRTGTTFTEITNTCTADNQITGDALVVDGECKIDVGSDMVIWTKHFTSFATYTQTVIPTVTPPSTGGGGGGAPSDTSAPTNVSITINNGAATTTSRTVTLTLSASDSSSIQMMISSSTTFSGASWENYSTTKSWLLTGENGIKTVYVKFKDAYSNTSGVVNDSISLNFSGVIEAPKVEPKVLGEKITNIFTDFIKAQKSLIKKIDKALTKRLAGKILLQVQDHGEAWYVDVISQNRFYLADGARAFDALRKFGLGITNKDLAKIPVGIEKRFLDNDSDADGLADKLEEGLGTDKNKKDTDGDGVSDYDEVVKNQTNPLGTGKLIYDNKLLNRLRGRIVLQVESRGEAWYINPADGKRYYMKDGGAAYQIMRFLSLGITNDNIRKINIGD